MIAKTKFLSFVFVLIGLLSCYSTSFSQTTIISDATWKGVGGGAAVGDMALLFSGNNDAAWLYSSSIAVHVNLIR